MSVYDASRVMGQLLRQHESGIQMYLVCRLGGASRAEEAYEELRQELVGASLEELQGAPSLPAFAYATARSLAVRHRSESDSSHSLESVVWSPASDQRPPAYAELLDRVRTRLDPLMQEAVELHYARELSIEDTIYVMQTEPDEGRNVLAEGTKRVHDLAADLDLEVDLAPLVRDAFRPDLTAKQDRVVDRPRVAPKLSEGSLVGGRFEVTSTARTGALASVYLANDTSVPGKAVVLHLMHRPASTITARNGLIRKLRLLESVVHPSVGRVVGYGWHGDRLWYATPYAEGQTLGELVEKGPLTAEEAVDIFVPASQGLAALHENGIVHRRLGFETVLLLEVGAVQAKLPAVVIVGFESWLTGELDPADDSGFMAPEVVRRLSETGQAGASVPSEDVFSLALLLLRSLEPHGSDLNVPKTGSKALFAHALNAALSGEPASRPSAADLSAAIARRSPKVRAERKRRRLWIPITLALSVAALLLVAVFVRQSRLELIREIQQGADAEILRQELEAEKARSKRLEAELGAPTTD